MGRLFCLPNQDLRIFCMYTRNKGVMAATPPGTEHISHATYLNEGAVDPNNRSNIDHFLVRKGANEADIFGKDVRVLTQMDLPEEIKRQNPSVGDRYGIQFQVRGKFHHLTPEIKRITITDVYEFMIGKNDPKVKSSQSLEHLDYLPYVGMPIVKGHAQIDIEGKQTFYPNCLFDLNLDVAKWCKSGISPDGKVMPWGDCIYCYASFKHTGWPYAFNVEKEILVQQIKEARVERAKNNLPTRYMRLGKRTEFGIPEFKPQLLATLEACLEEGIKVVFPSKYQKFDKEVADLLRRTDSTFLPSLGDDNLEYGAVMHGCTNEWRFEQGILFREAGVRVVPYILVRAHEEDGGEVFGRNLRAAEKVFETAQILPLITKNLEVAKKAVGGTKDLLGRVQKGLFGESLGGYEISTGRRGVPVNLHSSLVGRVGDNNGNIRLCLHNSQCSHCGKCFLPGEKGESIPAENVVLGKKTRRPHGKRDRYIEGETLFNMHDDSLKKFDEGKLRKKWEKFVERNFLLMYYTLLQS